MDADKRRSEGSVVLFPIRVYPRESAAKYKCARLVGLRQSLASRSCDTTRGENLSDS
jgi:hypothetical protein